MSVKPNFVGIGGQKCASTWLSECLRAHPQVFMSSPKELRYFSDNFDKGIDWYLDFFKNSGSYKCRGEFASNYIYSFQAAERIKSELGDIKVVAVVREPVERALSHIKHLIRDGDLPYMKGELEESDIRKILEKYPSVVNNSCYKKGLDKYREIFGISSVFIVSQETCKETPDLVLNALWEFFGVKKGVDISEGNKIVSAGVNPRFFWLEEVRRAFFGFARYRAPWIINLARKLGFSSVYRTINRGKDVTLSEDAENYLRRLCSDDWSETKRMLTVK
jgi:hypothetical protein